VVGEEEVMGKVGWGDGGWVMGGGGMKRRGWGGGGGGGEGARG